MFKAKLILLSSNFRGTEFNLTDEQYTCGRTPNRDICIQDVTVSSYHCDFVRSGESYFVRDHHSTNGTRVNGDPVNGDTPLKHADIVTIGMVEALYECGNNFSQLDAGSAASKTCISFEQMGDMQKTIACLPPLTGRVYTPEHRRKSGAYKLFMIVVVILSLLVLLLIGVLVYKIVTQPQIQSQPAETVAAPPFDSHRLFG